MDDPGQATQVLKRDGLGRVELVPGDPALVRRVACGGSVPASRLVAQVLLARERRALECLQGLDAVPVLMGEQSRACGLRTYLAGQPLHRATALPRDFFELLEQLVGRLHERGVCHNDLHKEQNILVLENGRPALIDFQLASVHPRRAGRSFHSRCGDDLRHVHKHRLRYERRGRPKTEQERARGTQRRRSPLAAVWRRTGKPLYNFVTRCILRTRDGEERRPSSGPWPTWTAPLGRD
ncbi:phosphotransferase [Engelhardtia mirabilis]|uniref:Serine/threonine protein kinase n=1 Tax=Engelhardtia mirabilis TaxID=2528011 RepID=A0A518BM84_9BACT|nr:serine/threonine protein kinase [Planctomycetes bacterium Pla133]QDV02416.1 serine/threonine protein kinase [Planctomycetes bacterium Pla86]